MLIHIFIIFKNRSLTFEAGYLMVLLSDHLSNISISWTNMERNIRVVVVDPVIA
jgi:hypothetical protein